jgi:ketosteroid isomerase-like protein
MKIYLIVIALILSGVTSCTVEHHRESDRRALINLTTRDWDENILVGDLDACVDSYTDNAVRIQDGKTLTGKDEIRTMLSSFRPGFTVSTVENKVEDLWISGDLASVRGTFTGSWVNKEWGDTLWTVGTWLDVCERQDDGTWKMVFTMASELR